MLLILLLETYASLLCIAEGCFQKEEIMGFVKSCFCFAKGRWKAGKLIFIHRWFFNHFLTLLQKDPHSDLAQWASVHWYSYEEISSVCTLVVFSPRGLKVSAGFPWMGLEWVYTEPNWVSKLLKKWHFLVSAATSWLFGSCADNTVTSVCAVMLGKANSRELHTPPGQHLDNTNTRAEG